MFTPEKFTANRDEVLKAEQIAAQLLGAEVNPTPKDTRYLDQLRAADLLKDGEPYCEVKVDWKSALTDNCCFEIGSLERSKAPYVVYVLPTYYLFARGRILAHSRDLDLRVGGDFNQELRLIKRAQFVRLPFVKRIG